MFLIKKPFIYLIVFLGGFLLKAKPGADPEPLRREGEANLVRYGILHDHASKKRKIESTPL